MEEGGGREGRKGWWMVVCGMFMGLEWMEETWKGSGICRRKIKKGGGGRGRKNGLRQEKTRLQASFNGEYDEAKLFLHRGLHQNAPKRRKGSAISWIGSSLQEEVVFVLALVASWT